MKGKWIFYRRSINETWSKSFVQDVIKTEKGELLELNNSEIYTNYPIRILRADIHILKTV